MSGVAISFLDSTVASGGAVFQVVSAANPLPVTISGGLTGFAVAGTIADGAAAGAQFPVAVGGVDAGGLVRRLLVDSTGALITAGAGNVQGTIANAAAGNPNPVVGGIVQGGTVRSIAGDANGNQFVVGNVANNVADSGNPVKIGGVYSAAAALAALTVGTRGDVQLDPQGNIRANIVGRTSTGADANSNNIIRMMSDTANSAASSFLGVMPLIFNGATWDRTAKPRAAFKLPASAATNNAANIKASAGTVYAISGMTTVLGPAFLKLFDAAGVPNPAALAQFGEFPLVGAAAINTPFQFTFPTGIFFPTGIAIAIVAGVADLNNVAIGANDVQALTIWFS